MTLVELPEVFGHVGTEVRCARVQDAGREPQQPATLQVPAVRSLLLDLVGLQRENNDDIIALEQQWERYILFICVRWRYLKNAVEEEVEREFLQLTNWPSHTNGGT